MLRERFIWLCVVVLVAGAGFIAGRDSALTTQEQPAQQTAAGSSAAQSSNTQNTPAAGQPALGRRPQSLIGVVDRIDGNTIVIKTAKGDLATVQLAAGGRIRELVDGQLAHLHSGERIVAIGNRTGDLFQATMVQFGMGPINDSSSITSP